MLVYDTGVKMILVLIMEVMGAHSGPPFVTPNTGMFFFFFHIALLKRAPRPPLFSITAQMRTIWMALAA